MDLERSQLETRLAAIRLELEALETSYGAAALKWDTLQDEQAHAQLGKLDAQRRELMSEQADCVAALERLQQRRAAAVKEYRRIQHCSDLEALAGAVAALEPDLEQLQRLERERLAVVDRLREKHRAGWSLYVTTRDYSEWAHETPPPAEAKALLLQAQGVLNGRN